MSKQTHHDLKIHLIDGTYELFRNHFGAPKRKSPDGREVGATVGFLRSMIALLAQSGTTHVACAFDHVIESFRNKLYPAYKTGEGIDPDLLAQFPLAEKVAAALGLVVWPMVEFEADDALATAAARFKDAKGVKQVLICSPDKDLAQSVRGKKVVCWDRRREIVYDDKGVFQKFGVHPESMPDWLALVGDTADGYPGIKGWGEKSASTVLARYRHLESIPKDFKKWKVAVSRAEYLSGNFESHREDALLFRRLATVREDVPLKEKLGDLEWRGANERLKSLCKDLGVGELPKRITRWRS